MATEAGMQSSVTRSERLRGPVMAFDFGQRRIGVAVGDFELGIGHPLHTVHYKEGQDPLDAIGTFVDEWKPVMLVVGMPAGADGTKHELAPAVQRFCRSLTRRFGLSVQLVDERYTSAEASGMLQQAGVRGRRQKNYLDQVAAQTILEDFFSQQEVSTHGDSVA